MLTTAVFSSLSFMIIYSVLQSADERQLPNRAAPIFYPNPGLCHVSKVLHTAHLGTGHCSSHKPRSGLQNRCSGHQLYRFRSRCRVTNLVTRVILPVNRVTIPAAKVIRCSCDLVTFK